MIFDPKKSERLHAEEKERIKKRKRYEEKIRKELKVEFEEAYQLNGSLGTFRYLLKLIIDIKLSQDTTHMPVFKPSIFDTLI